MASLTLHVRDLTVRYGASPQPAVSGLSVDVGPGRAVAIVGESGSGKSTAALAMTRLLGADVTVAATALEFAGRNVLSMSPHELRRWRARHVGMVFQDPMGSWNPARTIGAQLLDGLRAAGYSGDARGHLVSLLRRVGVERAAERLDDYPHRFSGGMLQRAMIAGALAASPELLVADEPTSALDTTVQAELLALLAEMRQESGASLIMISHDLGVVSRVADETVVMYAGRAVERGPTQALLRAPRHPYTWGLVQSIPRLDGHRKIPLRTVGAGGVSDAGCRFAPRCPLATERCTAEEPPLREIAGALVACHHAEKVPGALERSA